MLRIRIGITDSTTPDDLDRYFTQIWKHQKKVVLVFDTTQCCNLSIRRALKMKSILDKHRPSSKQFIEHSEILVKTSLAKNILRTALYIIRTERPVHIQKVKKSK